LVELSDKNSYSNMLLGYHSYLVEWYSSQRKTLYLQWNDK
jgi:hypothetical protein